MIVWASHVYLVFTKIPKIHTGTSFVGCIFCEKVLPKTQGPGPWPHMGPGPILALALFGLLRPRGRLCKAKLLVIDKPFRVLSPNREPEFKTLRSSPAKGPAI